MPAAKARDLAMGANVNFHDRSHFAQMEVDGDPAVLAALAQSTLVPNRVASVRHATPRHGRPASHHPRPPAHQRAQRSRRQGRGRCGDPTSNRRRPGRLGRGLDLRIHPEAVRARDGQEHARCDDAR
jgi:hypothetical protein